MRLFLILCIPLVGLLFFSQPASAEFDTVPFVQANILRVAPDDSAAFVPIDLPRGYGGDPKVTVLSRQGEWEEVSLYYRFKFNASSSPNICAMALFEGSFTGFRKISETNDVTPG